MQNLTMGLPYWQFKSFTNQARQILFSKQSNRSYSRAPSVFGAKRPRARDKSRTWDLGHVTTMSEWVMDSQTRVIGSKPAGLSPCALQRKAFILIVPILDAHEELRWVGCQDAEISIKRSPVRRRFPYRWASTLSSSSGTYRGEVLEQSVSL